METKIELTCDVSEKPNTEMVQHGGLWEWTWKKGWTGWVWLFIICSFLWCIFWETKCFKLIKQNLEPQILPCSENSKFKPIYSGQQFLRQSGPESLRRLSSVCHEVPGWSLLEVGAVPSPSALHPDSGRTFKGREASVAEGDALRF